MLDTTAITARRDTSFINLRTGEEGTYVLGLSVKPREIDLTGEQFNGYLKEEGMDEILAERTRSGTLGKGSRSVTPSMSKRCSRSGPRGPIAGPPPLGYTAEIVPLENPHHEPGPSQPRVEGGEGYPGSPRL